MDLLEKYVLSITFMDIQNGCLTRFMLHMY